MRMLTYAAQAYKGMPMFKCGMWKSWEGGRWLSGQSLRYLQLLMDDWAGV
jgi:hypothetical protein